MPRTSPQTALPHARRPAQRRAGGRQLHFQPPAVRARRRAAGRRPGFVEGLLSDSCAAAAGTPPPPQRPPPPALRKTVSKGCMVMPEYVPWREGCTLLLHRQCRRSRQSTCKQHRRRAGRHGSGKTQLAGTGMHGGSAAARPAASCAPPCLPQSCVRIAAGLQTCRLGLAFAITAAGQPVRAACSALTPRYMAIRVATL